MAARGLIRSFWQAFRKAHGGRPYFSWAELQRRGAVHYHALVVNPPWKTAAHFYRWSNKAWGPGWQQRRYEVRDGAWFYRRAGRYVKAYAKESSEKAYQQSYDELPREIRTFENNRLGFLAAQLDAHRDGYVLENLAPFNSTFSRRLLNWWLMQRLHHVEGAGGCSLRLEQRRSPRIAPRGPRKKGRRP